MCPTSWAQPTTSGSSDALRPNSAQASSDQAAASEIEQQRSRCRGDVRDVGPGETVHQPGVARGHDASGIVLPPQPRHLRRREVGVERQAGDPGQPRTVLDQVGTDRGRTAILPGDGCTERLTRRAIPGQHGLTLVGESDGAHAAAGAGDRFAAGRADRVPQLLGVLLDAAAGDGVRRDRGLDRAQGGAVLVEDHRFGRRRPLIESEDAHAGSLCQGKVSTGRPASLRVANSAAFRPVRDPLRLVLACPSTFPSRSGGPCYRNASIRNTGCDPARGVAEQGGRPCLMVSSMRLPIRRS